MSTNNRISHESFRKKYDKTLRAVDHQLAYSYEMINALSKTYTTSLQCLLLGMDINRSLHDILQNVEQLCLPNLDYRIHASSIRKLLNDNGDTTVTALLSVYPKSAYFKYIKSQMDDYDFYVSGVYSGRRDIEINDNLIIVSSEDSDDGRTSWPVIIPYQYFCDDLSIDQAVDRYQEWLDIHFLSPLYTYLYSSLINELSEEDRVRKESIELIRKKMAEHKISIKDISNV